MISFLRAHDRQRLENDPSFSLVLLSARLRSLSNSQLEPQIFAVVWVTTRAGSERDGLPLEAVFSWSAPCPGGVGFVGTSLVVRSMYDSQSPDRASLSRE
jgi:hypothetical protein